MKSKIYLKPTRLKYVLLMLIIFGMHFTALSQPAFPSTPSQAPLPLAFGLMAVAAGAGIWLLKRKN